MDGQKQGGRMERVGESGMDNNGESPYLLISPFYLQTVGQQEPASCHWGHIRQWAARVNSREGWSSKEPRRSCGAGSEDSCPPRTTPEEPGNYQWGGCLWVWSFETSFDINIWCASIVAMILLWVVNEAVVFCHVTSTCGDQLGGRTVNFFVCDMINTFLSYLESSGCHFWCNSLRKVVD